ncbi:substrate-binding domain-containing protein [Roseobacter sp. HKCCD9010]|uniref:LacI family transcriptional regulator n=1 Tax=unclassified Roseobacter TaxID=196798 RepID=UPI001492ABA8|nr:MULTISPECIES: LacI family transcriptional regulator [unclassified Roseobacter]MBF9049712.1 substrate-binding domain-containing protein [Rhodobacterales bacterium HKCCD4356]NNV11712.1 substrate-binding domain-containing protein [Roseobacter sp. HKCCD7357]NNV15896.1 substrate-binding domain-containing protein [Roseobacter sp. HKCCD8768]NNV25356.1 substrate-binding domain-containing protein [Roseobacter sp. HKCCD8192]NNV29613.1 substrate-binding domain-containing protein [Roseobacter sp. HKCCD
MTRDADEIAPLAPSEKPTLRTIAEMTGFAIATVSRALADDPRIAKTTREKVAKAAKSVGYVPDRAARRLRTGRTQVVSLLLNTEHEFLGFTHEFLTGITDALRGTGYSVTVVPDQVGEDRLAPVRTILRNNLADGLLFTRTECFDPRARLLMESGFPFVSHGRTEFTTPHAWVDFDNEAFARAAVHRLVEKGRKRISLILPEDRFTFAQHLRYGFMSAVRETGVEYEIVTDVTLDSSTRAVSEALIERRQKPNPPDGYICVGEVMALVTLSALDDTGVTPGVEADVLAKRASPIFDNIRPRIETVFEDLRATGRAMSEMLLRRMAGEPPEELHVMFKPDAGFGDKS